MSMPDDAIRRYDDGICRDCTEPPVPGRRRCRTHLDVNAARQKAHRAEMADEIENPAAPIPRCRCGLMLPCDGCLMSARDYAESRR
jgi:hypothetical protein